MPASRRLAAILAADVVGYSRMMGEDEAGTALAVREARAAAQAVISDYGGRMFKTMGDGFLVEFPSVVAAVECALRLQARPVERGVVYRMGVNLGDVLVEGDDLIGDGVNIAARLEGIAPPGGLSVSAAAYEQVRGRIDAKFEDIGEQTLKNITRPIRTYSVTPAGDAAAAPRPPQEAEPVRRRPPRVSIVVLPFANLGGGQDQEYFVDGVTESLTTDLSRISGAFVIARNTAFAYKGKQVDVREIARDLNVRYALEGSVQRGADRVRVNVQLIEAETGAHLWASRFDKPIAELFQMQDEIVSRIANELSGQIVRVEARRAEKESNPDVLDYWLRGLDAISNGANTESLAQARDHFARALAIDPNSVIAMLGVAFTDTIAAQILSQDGDGGRLAEAERLVERALALEPRNPQGHYCMGITLLFTRRPEQGIRELEHALELDPNMAFAHANIGLAKTILGRPEETEAHVMESLRLSPRDVSAYVWFDFAAIAKLLLGLPSEAVTWSRKSVETNRYYPLARFHLAAGLALCGQMSEARIEAKAGLAIDPNFTIRRYELRALSDSPAYRRQRAALLEGLRLAGVPEG